MRRNLGFIFQAHNLFDSLSAYENVKMALQLGDCSAARCGSGARKCSSGSASDIASTTSRARSPAASVNGSRLLARSSIVRSWSLPMSRPLPGQGIQRYRRHFVKELTVNEGCTVIMVTHESTWIRGDTRVDLGAQELGRSPRAGRAGRATGPGRRASAPWSARGPRRPALDEVARQGERGAGEADERRRAQLLDERPRTASMTYGPVDPGSSGSSASRSAADPDRLRDHRPDPGHDLDPDPERQRDHDVAEQDGRVHAVPTDRLQGDLGDERPGRGMRRASCPPRNARYSGSDRPACRMNHTGGVGPGRPRAARTSGESAVVGAGLDITLIVARPLGAPLRPRPAGVRRLSRTAPAEERSDAVTPEPLVLFCPTCACDCLTEAPPCPDGHGLDCPERACIECGTALVFDDLARPAA